MIAGEFGAYKAKYGLKGGSSKPEYTDEYATALDSAIKELKESKEAAFRNFDFSGYAAWAWEGASDTFMLMSNFDPTEKLIRALAPKKYYSEGSEDRQK